MRMFKRFTLEDEGPSRQWARDNYEPGTPINPVWHPVVRHECEAINVEANRVLEDGIGIIPRWGSK